MGRFLGVVAVILFGTLLVGYVMSYVDWGLRTLFYSYPGPTWGGLLLIIAIPFLVRLINRTGAVLAMDRHIEESDWQPIDPVGREWPWTDLRLRGTIRVLRAWSFETSGFPITAGEIKWTGNALAGAVVPERGKGVFVIVHLPTEVPSMAMRNRFDRVGDSPMLDSSALRLALLNDDIPPWTARGRTLFTIEVPKAWIHPSVVDGIVRRALRVVELLGLTPDQAPDRS
ncbi:hypothetical protein [Actinoplanes sichuanensis]|uniref:DUF3137 domain-containing protein n=1 Tax=Actinoplanes sichuanensis TaxID=512349 RepID=A0ABW4ATT2_9ACTN|nr:hypothetical protein [Actinoplanes sichuanensis]